MRYVPLVLVLCLSGCISHLELSTTIPARVPVGTTIEVVKAEDGSFEGEQYPGSGGVLASRLAGALTAYYPGSAAVGSGGNGYVVKPQIIRWEERATEWSGRPDRVQISLPLYHSGKLIGQSMVSGSSSEWTMGVDHPEDLLRRPFAVYAARLAGKPSPDSFVIVKAP